MKNISSKTIISFSVKATYNERDKEGNKIKQYRRLKKQLFRAFLKLETSKNFEWYVKTLY